MRKPSRHRKSSSSRNRRGKAGRAAKPAKAVHRSARKPASPRSLLASDPATADRAGSVPKAGKQAALLDLLSRPAGATLAMLGEASGWQPHSVRGFLAGVVRKRMKLDLVSAIDGDQRVYRIVGAPARRA